MNKILMIMLIITTIIISGCGTKEPEVIEKVVNPNQYMIVINDIYMVNERFSCWDNYLRERINKSYVEIIFESEDEHITQISNYERTDLFYPEFEIYSEYIGNYEDVTCYFTGKININYSFNGQSFIETCFDYGKEQCDNIPENCGYELTQTTINCIKDLI